jgi:general secretion pathway protein C
VLVVWLAWLLADAVWLAWKGPGMPSLSPDREVITVNTNDQGAALSVARVRQWQVFGPVDPVAASAPIEAPETRLRLELLGVFQHPDPEKAGAIIAEQGKEGELFRPGAKVPGNATLEEIYPDQVILNRMGQREALKLKMPDLAAGFRQTARARDIGRPAVRRPPQPAPEKPVDMDSLSQQRQMVISQLGLEASGAGYRIGDSAPADMLARVGLRGGDVLVSVNGHALGSEESDLAAMESFRSTGTATVVVQRGEQQFTVTYPP